MAIRLGIIGAAGRMGRRIGVLACQDERFTVTCAIERPDHPGQGVDFGELIGQGELDLPDAAGFEGLRFLEALPESAPERFAPHELLVTAEPDSPRVGVGIRMIAGVDIDEFHDPVGVRTCR